MARRKGWKPSGWLLGDWSSSYWSARYGSRLVNYLKAMTDPEYIRKTKERRKKTLERLARLYGDEILDEEE